MSVLCYMYVVLFVVILVLVLLLLCEGWVDCLCFVLYVVIILWNGGDFFWFVVFMVCIENIGFLYIGNDV